MKTKNVVKQGLFALLLLAVNVVFAQTSISGTVVDAENQEAIPGANVIVVVQTPEQLRILTVTLL